jgi:hypothetical protein
MSRWAKMSEGRHAGKTLPQIILTDPDWFFWALENHAIRGGNLMLQAHELASKAKRIKVPKDPPSEWHFEYMFDAEGKFRRLELVPASRPKHQTLGDILRLDHLNLALIRERRHYDKLGYKLLMKTFKSAYFGSENAKLTRERCEAFFDEPSNFL